MTTTRIDEIREAAEADLATFIALVHPMRVLGSIHKELASWWTRGEAKSHQLVLLPRDHGKSAMVAYRVAWAITKDPTIRVLYISSTANLATKQLKFIKDILTSKTYRRYWPLMVNEEEGKREKWTENEISVDHPLRKAEAVRDPTVFTAGLTTGITGMHCDIAVMDDVVVRENAYTEDGREKVRSQYSLLSSIEGADAKEWIVGTRYDPNDLYNDLQGMVVEQYDESGALTSEIPLYETFERAVEDVGDGTGEFLWPRQQRYDGKWFGFNSEVLARKRAQYLDKTQFRAQYYNDPNDIESADITPDLFQYYDTKNLTRRDGYWYVGSMRLNVFAAVDFAFSLAKRADYTSIVVVGVDTQTNYYILDIERFKTTKIKEYFDKILSLHQKWGFRKIRAEVNAAQAVIVEDLKENYISRHGLALSVDAHRPNRHEGTKEERIRSTLQARYENGQIWHYRGGNTQTLEEELVKQRPPHDDIKDALASCIDICVAPSSSSLVARNKSREMRQSFTHTRFGGIS
jgi:hypothetical protein